MWPEFQFAQSLTAQIGWTHHQVLMDSFGGDVEEYLWYSRQASMDSWTVRQLEAQIHLRLHERTGKAISNFSDVVEASDAQAISQIIKDPYIFDFLTIDKGIKERQLEEALLSDIQKLLLELGTGFSFYGRQKSLIVGDEEFFLDLIFYHHVLRRFVVIELKAGKFKPEYAGKMNFYLNAVDSILRVGDDKESVGIILCSDHHDTTATLALARIQSPIAVSTWKSIEGVNPEDKADLEELEDVRQKLIERVNRRLPEMREAQKRK